MSFGNFLLPCIYIVFLLSVSATADRTFIVKMDKTSMPAAFTDHKSWYASVLATVNAKYEASNFLHIYDVVFHGFSAKLTPSQAADLSSKPGVTHVLPDGIKHLHTTYSPHFLKLTGRSNSHPSKGGKLWRKSWYGSDAIVGIFDTGVWPESKSFSDHKMSAIPSRWKGKCEEGPGFNVSLCNKKLIGARYFFKGYEAMSGPINGSLEFKSARDSDGHGTHTASTAAGRYVYGADLLGFASGKAQGMAPKARIAAYKVCWSSGCFDSDILAAFDQAVSDGVDVISLSVGGGVMPYYLDSIALGSFGAMEHGVFVACSGGNEGPAELSVTNVAPWITTIGASTMDRIFPANVILGDGRIFKGVSLYSGKPLNLNRQIPLIYGADASLTKNGSDSYSASLCMKDSLDANIVAGKMVLCDRGNNPRVEKGYTVLTAGGAGMILTNEPSDGEGLVADSHMIAATAVGAAAGSMIRNYIAENKTPTATIRFYGTVYGSKPSPVVASFSSRGPNPETAEILKPDVIAPGVNILAAWSGDSGPTGLPADDRRVQFNIISGTSMACPHVSGLAALLKAAHKDWSPAAIKSALMTTAYVSDDMNGDVIEDEASRNSSTPFDFGAGHVDPERALDPGLVYDIGVEDYEKFLCSLNYSNEAVGVISRKKYGCPKQGGEVVPVWDLNYPSMAVVFDQIDRRSLVYVRRMKRVVKNVGPLESIYVARVVQPKGVMISVEPTQLVFGEGKKEVEFEVTVKTRRDKSLGPGESISVFGVLVWSDGRGRNVQSSISITKQQPY